MVTYAYVARTGARHAAVLYRYGERQRSVRAGNDRAVAVSLFYVVIAPFFHNVRGTVYFRVILHRRKIGRSKHDRQHR